MKIKSQLILFSSVLLLSPIFSSSLLAQAESSDSSPASTSSSVNDNLQLSLTSEQKNFMTKFEKLYTHLSFDDSKKLVLNVSNEDLMGTFGFTQEETTLINNMLAQAPQLNTQNESPIHSRMYIHGSTIRFTHDDIMSALYSAAMIGPAAVYGAIVALGAISLGPIGAGIAAAVGILGFPSLAGFTYNIIQAAANGQGVYIGVQMNGIFPNIISGTY